MTEKTEEAAALARAVRQSIRRTLRNAWVPLEPEDLEARCRWLLSLRPGGRGLWVRNSRRAAHPDLVREFLRRSYEARLSSPAEAQHLAQAAVDLAEALSLGPAGGLLVRTLRAEAWGHLANSARLLADFEGAERAWDRVNTLVLGDALEPLLVAALDNKKATLRQVQGRYQEACALFQRSAEVRGQRGEPHAAGKSRLGLAITHFYAGDARQALVEATEAAPQIDGIAEPEMSLALVHNTLFFLEAAHQYEEALAYLPSIQPWYVEMGGVIRCRADWLHGRLYAALKGWRVAAHYHEKARRGFLREGCLFDAALAGFDHAYAMVQVGGYLHAQKIAVEMYGVFSAKEIPHEAAKALLLFADTARQARADQRFMQRVADLLAPYRQPGRHASGEET